jgi:Tfp pilus assembly protein PilF
MSRMLNLVDRLLSRSRTFHRLGREGEALSILGRVVRFRELPAEAAEEAQSRLARIYLGQRRFRQARRHLKAVLVQQPENARYHHLMAAALAADSQSDPQRAADHYRRSIQLDPEQPRVLGEFGLLAIRLGQTDEGLAALCRAVELSPNDPEIVNSLAKGFVEVDRIDEAREVLTAAMFRNSRDHRFRELWNVLRFRLLSEAQAAARRKVEAARQEEEGPTILPFVRPAPGTEVPSSGGKRIRRDRPSPLRPPHFPGWTTMPDRKHA